MTSVLRSRRVKIIGITVVFLCAAGIGAASAANGGPPGPPDFPKNAKGDTYGKLPFDGSADQVPDLVAVVGTHGKQGYVRPQDLHLTDDAPSSPEEALKQQSQSVDEEIPVYGQDGSTVIDTFVVEGSSDPMPPPPSGTE